MPDVQLSGVPGDESDDRLPEGTRVEVRRRFDAHWARGFEVVAATPTGYRIRRLSDGSELPIEFDDDDVRPVRERRGGMWWA